MQKKEKEIGIIFKWLKQTWLKDPKWNFESISIVELCFKQEIWLYFPGKSDN